MRNIDNFQWSWYNNQRLYFIMGYTIEDIPYNDPVTKLYESTVYVLLPGVITIFIIHYGSSFTGI